MIACLSSVIGNRDELGHIRCDEFHIAPPLLQVRTEVRRSSVVLQISVQSAKHGLPDWLEAD